MIDFYGSEPQFVAQLASTYLALPAEWRGWFGVSGGAAAMRARELGVEPVEGVPSGTNPIVVASYGDLGRARAGARPVIYSEHGAGQQYPSSGFSNYSGGQDRAGVVACLVPGSIAAAAHRRSYPGLPVYEIGVPRLDPFCVCQRGRAAVPLGTTTSTFTTPLTATTDCVNTVSSPRLKFKVILLYDTCHYVKKKYQNLYCELTPAILPVRSSGKCRGPAEWSRSELPARSRRWLKIPGVRFLRDNIQIYRFPHRGGQAIRFPDQCGRKRFLPEE